MYFKVTRHLYNFLWYFQLAQLMANIKLYWNSLRIQSRKELCIMLIQSHWNKLYKNRRLLSHSLEKNIKILLSFYFLVVFFYFPEVFGLFTCFFVSLEIVQDAAHSHRKLLVWTRLGLDWNLLICCWDSWAFRFLSSFIFSMSEQILPPSNNKFH